VADRVEISGLGRSPSDVRIVGEAETLDDGTVLIEIGYRLARAF